MKINKLKNLMAFLFLFLSLSAYAQIQIALTPMPNPPQEGENELELLLKEEDKPLEKAELSLNLSMPAMGSMPQMDEAASIIEKGKGKYIANFNIAMSGTWNIEIRIKKASKITPFHYSMTTNIMGVNDKNSPTLSIITKNTNTNSENNLNIGPERIQKIGVRFATAKTRNMQTMLDAIGIIEADNTNRAELTLRFSGYLEKQLIGRIGDKVEAGQALVSIYSPDLIAAENEYIISHGNSFHDKQLVKLSEDKLKTLGLTSKEIKELNQTKKPQRNYILRSPINGSVLNIFSREGSAVNQGDILYIISNLNKNYIVAKIFQQEAHHLFKSQLVKISLSGDKSKIYDGKVELIYPNSSEGSGTLDVRVISNNYIPELQPGVYVELRFITNLGDLLSVPSEAILYSGKHNYVFIDKGNGILEPREVIVGSKTEDLIEIKEGLEENERVVASGQFLISSEAQFRSALPKWKLSKENEL